MAAAQSDLRGDLAAIVGDAHVLTGPAIERTYDTDAYGVEHFPPQAVVLPADTAEVAAVVRYCNAHGLPFTPRGAGTGLSGGAMPALGGVVVSTKRLTKVLEIDLPGRRLKAQTGIANARLSAAVAADGFEFAPDPSSQSVSTLGGNIAENSGGPHTLKYGVTAQHILAVTLVDASGHVREVARGPGYDLLSLVVGAEGTLGIVTEAWVKLTPLRPRVETALFSFASVRSACDTVAAIVAAGVLPAALEMMDERILVAVRSAFGLDYPDGTLAMLLVECDGEPAAVGDEMARVVEIAKNNGTLQIQTAQDEAERARLWHVRKKGIGAMGRYAPTIVTHDGVIPPSKLPDMLDFVYAVAAEAGVGVANIFHAGDGNLHPCFYFDEREPGVVDKVVAAGEKIIHRCLELGGSVSGEHGIGVEKSGLLAQMFDDDSMRLQLDFRRIFHENPLCNPCKVVPDNKSCVEHKVRWRGVAT
ncbi:MAG: FAD-binding protein [Armatimonadetes bacterium]|nr:FAD-binding protein [Armatimonadota bacterium]